MNKCNAAAIKESPNTEGGGGGAVIKQTPRDKKESSPKGKKEATPRDKKEAAPKAEKEAAPKVKKEAAPKAENNYQYLRLPINETIIEINNIDNKKIKILKLIDDAHDLLYQAENIVGQKALQIIMSVLFLKLLQPYISTLPEEGKIDLLNKEYYLEKYDDDEDLNELLSFFENFKNLTNKNLKTIRNNSESDAIKQMGEILKLHPITRMIYTEANFIKVREASTVQTLFNFIDNKVDFQEFIDNEDIIGEIYEHILTKYVKNDSKELGQYFTPRILMKLILTYKKDRICDIFSNVEGEINICDPCMGTGGWLVSGYNMLKDIYADKLTLAGGDVEPETFQYGIMNIILTLHKFPTDIQCNSSLTHVNNNKHHLILTNPPFNSKKKIKFSQIKENFENDAYTTANNISINNIFKLKRDDPPIQFLELDYYKLADNGMCIIVLPYGEFFFGSKFKQTRLHFLKTTAITDIILVPVNTFTHTGIKTCIVIFEKNDGGTQCINYSRISKNCSALTHITSVHIDDINSEPENSWYLQDYLIDGYVEELKTKINKFEWVEFGLVFDLERGHIQSSKVEEDENGDGIFINWSIHNNYKKISDCPLSGENIFMSIQMPNGKDGGYMVIKYHNGKCNYSDLMAKLNIKNEFLGRINLKFIFYFLMSIKNHIETIYEKGACQKSLDIKNLNRMQIPMPPLHIQTSLMTKLDSSEYKIKYMKLIVEQMYKDLNGFFGLTVEIENRKSETEWAEFGSVFDLERGQLQSSKAVEDEGGEGVFINLSKSGNFKKISNIKLDGENIFISNTSPIGLIQYYTGKCNYSDLLHLMVLKPEYLDRVNKKYMYYFLLSIKENIEEQYQKGACNQTLDIKNLNRMQIQIPSIVQQNKCIERITHMEEIIKRWKSDIVDMQSDGADKFLEYLEYECHCIDIDYTDA